MVLVINKNMNKENIVKIKVPHTQFWVLGEQQTDKSWNAYLIHPQSNIKELIKTKISTLSFSVFSSTVLNTSFPYSG